MKKTVVLIVITLLGFVACKKIDLPDDSTKALIGKWKYLKSSGGITSGQSSGLYDSKSTIEFEKKGKFKRYKGPFLTHSEKFNFSLRNTSHTGKEEYIIVYKGHTIAQYFKINGDTLYLSDEASDAFSYWFLRKH